MFESAMLLFEAIRMIIVKQVGKVPLEIIASSSGFQKELET